MGLYTIARRRINARPAASDVGQRLAAIGTTSAVDGLSIAVYNRRWRNSKSYRRPYRRIRPASTACGRLPSPPGIQKRQAAAMATWRLLASMGWRLVAVVALRSYRTEPQEYKRRRLNKCLNPAGH